MGAVGDFVWSYTDWFFMGISTGHNLTEILKGAYQWLSFDLNL